MDESTAAARDLTHALLKEALKQDCVLERVRYLLKNGVDVNKRYSDDDDHDGVDLSAFVSTEKRLDNVLLLIQHGADVNATDADGLTPCMMAAFNPGKKTSFRNATLLHIACHGGGAGVTKILIENGANDFMSFLFHYCITGDLSMFDQLLQYYVYTKGSAFVNQAHYARGVTLLHAACIHGQLEIVKCLVLQHGADMNVRMHTKHELTPLVCACCENHVTIVKFLLEQNTTKANLGDDGSLSLNLACRDGHADLARVLLEIGKVDINGTIEEGGPTPLHLACYYGHLDVVELLLEKQADVNAKDDEGYPPIIYAYSKNQQDVAKLFVCFGLREIAFKAMFESQDESRKLLFPHILHRLGNLHKTSWSLTATYAAIQKGAGLTSEIYNKNNNHASRKRKYN